MRRIDLVADCGACAAVCCIALPFDASEDFAFDKPAGVACRHLRWDSRCAIHDRRVVEGLSGCALFDCYGAGPRVTRAFDDARRRHEAFGIARELHELLWLLDEATKLCPAREADLAEQLTAQLAELDALDTSALLDTDLRPYAERSRELLRRVGDALGGRQGLRKRLSVVA